MNAVENRRIWRWHSGGALINDTDDLAAEEPLEIRVGGRPISVTMRTPGHDAELAAGFLLSEGIVRQPRDLAGVEPFADHERCNIVNATLAPEVTVDFAQLTRHVFASSSCGLCGKTTIDAIRRHFGPVESDLVIDAEMLLGLPERLRLAQRAFDRTGGLHAAAIFDARGELLVLREDVGRHNAVDKVLGHGLLAGLPPFDRHILLVSGRSSFEIMQKALAGRLPIVAAVSAPSALAVQFAEENGQTLVGFLRGPKMNIYCGAQRLRLG